MRKLYLCTQNTPLYITLMISSSVQAIQVLYIVLDYVMLDVATSNKSFMDTLARCGQKLLKFKI